VERPENQNKNLCSIFPIARVTIIATHVKFPLILEKVLLYSLPSFLSAGVFGGSTAKNKKNNSASFATLR
jgi:hypothetical protein